MKVNKKGIDSNVDLESDTHYVSFNAELDSSAYPMWALVAHLQGPETFALTRRVSIFCLKALQDWLNAINFTSSDAVSNCLKNAFLTKNFKCF